VVVVAVRKQSASPQLQYLDSLGNSGGDVPTGTGYSYSWTTSAVGTGGGQSRHDAFTCQGTLILGERTEHMKQQFARRRRGIHAFGERTEGNLFFLQRVHDGEQMRQRSAQPIQLPDDKHVARLHERQRLDQPRSIVLGAGRNFDTTGEGYDEI
jgi:hypothetical protein